MGCGKYFDQLHEIEGALKTMRRYGISESSSAYQALHQQQGAIMGRLGLTLPRLSTQLSSQAGFSPGTITLWNDNETGYFAEYRASPNAPPIYHRVSDDEAMAILTKQIPPELAARLEAPDEYVGE